MADIAQLGIAVDTSQTKLAARELDNLAAAGAKAEGSTKKLGSTSKQAMEQAAAATAKAQQTMERMLAAQERQEKLMEQMAREMQQLTQALQGNASANNAAAQAAQNAAQAMGQQSRAAKDAQGAIEGASKASGGSAKSMNDAERAAVAMGAGLARAVAVAGALAAAVGVLMVSVAKSATEIERFALMADATPEQLQRMAAGAKTAGMELENYASTIKDVQDKIGDFMQTGGGELKDFFEKIAPQVGVTADSFKNLSGPDALQLFYNSLEKANLSQKETVFWMEAIADDATNLIPLLQQNGAGFEAAADRAQKYGAVLSDYALAASKEFKSQTDEMALAIEGASNILAVGLMPVVSETIDSLLAYSAESGAAEVATNAVKAVLETLIVVASDVAFVFKGVRTEIGGIAAQAGAFLSLDFSRVKAIREMMKEDASAAKAELDAFQQRILNADKAAKAAFAVTDAVKKAKFGTEEYVTAVNGLIKAQASGQITTAQMNATLRSVSPAATSAGKSLSGMGIGAEKAKKASEDAAKAASQYAKDLSATYAELNGVSNDYYGQIEKYQAQLKKRDITEAQYIELVEKLIEKQPFAIELTKEQTQAFKEQEDARKKAYDATEKAFQQEVETAQKSAKAAQEKVGQLSDEAQAIEISKAKHITLAEAMEEVIVKRLEDQLESAKQAGNQELLDAIAAEIKARKELGKALGDREVREAADDAAQYAGKSWKATADKINNDLTYAIIAGFEGGKNGAQALKDSLVNMFKDMVLRPVISAIVAPVSVMLSSGAQAMMGGVGGWALAGIAAIATMMDFSGETRFGGGYQLNGDKQVKYTAGPGGGQINQAAQEQVATDTYKAINSILKSFGSTLEVIDFYAGLETSGKGKGGTFAGGKLSSGAEFGKKWQAGMYSQDLTAEEAVKQYGEQMKVVTVEALKAATDIPQYLQAELAKVDVTKLTGETAGLVLEEVNRMFTTFSTVKAAFEILNKPMFDTTTAGYELTESFVNLFGGLENFKSATASYYENFYSESERFNNAQQQLTQTLTEAGLAVPTTREAYRQLVEAQDLTTEAGRKNYAVLLKNAGAFAELTPAASAANKQIAGLNKMFAGLGVNTKLAETKFDKATKEMFESLGVSVEEYSNSIADVIAGIATGKIPAGDAGAELANAAVGGITNAIAQGASQAIAAQFVNSIITPIIANIMAGNEALAGINLEAGLANLKTGATALGTVLQQIGPTIGGIAADAAAIISASVAGVQGATTTTSSSGSNSLFAIGGSAVPDRPYQSPALEAFGSLANETIESNKKVSELLQKLLNPEREYANRYLELADKLIQKQVEFGLEVKKQSIDTLEGQYADRQQMLGFLNPLIDKISTNFQQVASGISNKDAEFKELAAKIIERGGYNTDTGMIYTNLARDVGFYVGQAFNGRSPEDFLGGALTDLYSSYEQEGNAQGFIDTILTAMGVADVSNADITAATENLARLEKELREWYIAQARVIAVEDYATNLEEAAAAKSKTAELKRTGGLEDPVTKLKEQFAAKMQAIDDGIGAALMAEVDGLRGQTASESVLNPIKLALSQKNQLLEMLSGDTSGWQASVEKSIQDDENFLSDFSNWETMTAPIMSGVADRQAANKSLLASLQDGSLLTKTASEITALEDQMTAAMLAATDPEKQQDLLDEIAKYKGGITEWFEAQAELLSTEMLVDINKQITALEAEEKGPLTTIKDAIQKYADDFEALGTLTADVQAQLDKLSGLQLDQARTSLYDQLLSQEERRAKEQEKLNAAFTELGATTPASTDALRAMIDAARDAGNVGLADSLLELVPAFVALQGAADGAGSALDRAMQDVDKAFAALQRSINAEKDRINADAQAQIDAINAGAEAREKAIDDARQQVQDLGGIFDDITKAVKTLRGNAQDEAMQMEQARAYISMALSVAQAGGTVDREKLREAMGAVTKDNAQSYVSGGDYRFAQARQAAELQALADITGEQKDVAQATLDAALEANKAAQEQIDAIIEARDKQLKALDDQLKAAQEQIDVMNGIDISVLGVGDAVIAFDTAMATYQSEKSRIDAENLALQAAIDEKIKQQKEQDLEICIMQVDAINKMSSDIVSAIGSIPAPVKPPPSSSGPVITYDGAQGPGLYVNGGLTGGIMPKFPSFDVGTNYVPNDMIAQIHEGEAIVPKEFNPAAFGGVKTDDAQIASLVVSLTTEVQRLQTIVEAGNNEQRRTADAVNGRPEAPMLVETV